LSFSTSEAALNDQKQVKKINFLSFYPLSGIGSTPILSLANTAKMATFVLSFNPSYLDEAGRVIGYISQ
jgi:hypothetical protein